MKYLVSCGSPREGVAANWSSGFPLFTFRLSALPWPFSPTSTPAQRTATVEVMVVATVVATVLFSASSTRRCPPTDHPVATTAIPAACDRRVMEEVPLPLPPLPPLPWIPEPTSSTPFPPTSWMALAATRSDTATANVLTNSRFIGSELNYRLLAKILEWLSWRNSENQWIKAAWTQWKIPKRNTYCVFCIVTYFSAHSG